MKIIDRVKKLFAHENERLPENEDIVREVICELERRRNERMPFELAWRLNAAFLAGDQFCEIDPSSRRLENSLPEYDYEERGVYNRISPLLDARLANLKDVSFAMSVRAATDEADDIARAQVSRALIENAYNSGDFEMKKNSLIGWAELTGSSFLLSCWDKKGGRLLSRTEKGEDGVREGALAYTLLTPYEVFPEDLYRSDIGEQGSVILEQILPARQIRELYGVHAEGREIECPALRGGTRGTVTRRDCEKVITYMSAPSQTSPDGLLIQIAAGEIVYNGPLPEGIIPITVFRSREVSGQFFGRSVIEELIPLQRAYNGCKNKIHDYICTLAGNSLLVEEGSVDLEEMERSGTAPGVPVVYKKGYNPPVPMTHESLPPQVYTECEQLARDMEYVAGVSQLMVIGSTGVGTMSGTAISSLREIDSTRLALCAENMRQGAAATAKLWLKIYKAHCPGALALAVAGEGKSAQVLTWCAQDINSFDVYFENENELRMTDAERRESFVTAYKLGIFNQSDGSVPAAVRAKAAKIMRVGDLGGMPDENELQRERAERENTVFERTRDIGGIGEFDDDEIHISVHRAYALGVGYEALCRERPETAELFAAHIRAHEQRRAENVQEAEMPL